ncbi:MAG TPA: hypothetical protein VGO64_06655 [Candidatus Limnocylindrales bacterium]|nr:hypothetical protein [Candidatus Limnocylindrales bacterium]
MRRDPEPAKPLHVLDHGVGGAAEWVRRSRHVERDVVSLVRADLDGIKHQDTVKVSRRIRWTRAIPMIGKDGERQSGASRRGRDRRLVAEPVGARGVDVISAADRPRRKVPVVPRLDASRSRRKRERKQKDAGRDERDQRQDCRLAGEDWLTASRPSDW